MLDRAFYQDLHTYLPEDLLALSDRLSMAHSLELRVPFVDHKLMEFCATIPAHLKIHGLEKKYLLKKAAKRYLPGEVLNHRKQGFASPMASWLRNDLREYVRDTLAKGPLSTHGLFNWDTVNALMEEHMDRRESHDKQIFTLLMFQKWFEGAGRNVPRMGRNAVALRG